MLLVGVASAQLWSCQQLLDTTIPTRRCRIDITSVLAKLHLQSPLPCPATLRLQLQPPANLLAQFQELVLAQVQNESQLLTATDSFTALFPPVYRSVPWIDACTSGGKAIPLQLWGCHSSNHLVEDCLITGHTYQVALVFDHGMACHIHISIGVDPSPF